jgi:N6-L-threonylcarbamoyladenine synthase
MISCPPTVKVFTRSVTKASARTYHVLAIETSCDDTAVALIERRKQTTHLIDHDKISLDNSRAGGIIPSDAQVHHMKELPGLVSKLLQRNSLESADLICATRGPGMFGCLSSGVNFAKGLAFAWKKPLVGVHHMLGHLLTPRFFTSGSKPAFPFHSLLVSGGHTMVVESNDLLNHNVLVDTIDIAVGDALDKCARELGMQGNMLGLELEKFCNSSNGTGSELGRIPEDFKFPIALQNGKKYSEISFSFAGYASSMKRAIDTFSSHGQVKLSDFDRRELGKRIQEAIYKHIAIQTESALKASGSDVSDLVCSGGVASNQLFRSTLSAQLPKANFHFTHPQWCTDNALMIGWAGIELYERGLTTRLDAVPRARWPLQELMEDGYWERK